MTNPTVDRIISAINEAAKRTEEVRAAAKKVADEIAAERAQQNSTQGK